MFPAGIELHIGLILLLYARLKTTAARTLSGVCVMALALGCWQPARAQDLTEGMLLSDTEIDATLAEMARPVIEAGHLVPGNVRLHMIVDDSINAFVNSSTDMFLNTGLLLKSKTPNEVIGVMAHETGHIVGGHTVMVSSDMAAVNSISLLSTLLGVAAGIATGNPEVGLAIMMGGQRAALGRFLSFTRSQEGRADQFALQALDDTHQSAQGLYNFFERLRGEELLISTNQDPYVRSHPITTDRMEVVGAWVKKAHYSTAEDNPELVQKYRRMVAKLFAFLKPQIATLQKYPESDKSIEGRYARAIAYYRRGQFDKALPIVDNLLTDLPKDPYFWQIKGDMLLSKAKIDDAVVAYRESIKYLPNAPEILTGMSRAMNESNNPEYFPETEKNLKHALELDPNNPDTWDLLAAAYAHNDKPGLSAYAAAERAILTEQFGDVARYTIQAEKLLEKDTPIWYRLQDIKILAQNSLHDMKGRRR